MRVPHAPARKCHARIDAPRERVFDYLSNVANHAEFTDHYLDDFRLERLRVHRTWRVGELAHELPARAQWGDAAITELDPPHRIVLEGRSGRIGRIPTRAEYRLIAADHDMTRVEYSSRRGPAIRWTG